MDKDPYFKDFELADYKFIVVNRKTLLPLVWKFTDTKKYGTLYYGKNNQYECKDPFDLGRDLNYYLTSAAKVPLEIELDKPNDIITWLNK